MASPGCRPWAADEEHYLAELVGQHGRHHWGRWDLIARLMAQRFGVGVRPYNPHMVQQKWAGLTRRRTPKAGPAPNDDPAAAGTAPTTTGMAQALGGSTAAQSGAAPDWYCYYDDATGFYYYYDPEHGLQYYMDPAQQQLVQYDDLAGYDQPSSFGEVPLGPEMEAAVSGDLRGMLQWRWTPQETAYLRDLVAAWPAPVDWSQVADAMQARFGRRIRQYTMSSVETKWHRIKARKPPVGVQYVPSASQVPGGEPHYAAPVPVDVQRPAVSRAESFVSNMADIRISDEEPPSNSVDQDPGFARPSSQSDPLIEIEDTESHGTLRLEPAEALPDYIPSQSLVVPRPDPNLSAFAQVRGPRYAASTPIPVPDSVDEITHLSRLAAREIVHKRSLADWALSSGTVRHRRRGLASTVTDTAAELTTDSVEATPQVEPDVWSIVPPQVAESDADISPPEPEVTEPLADIVTHSDALQDSAIPELPEVDMKLAESPIESKPETVSVKVEPAPAARTRASSSVIDRKRRPAGPPRRSRRLSLDSQTTSTTMSLRSGRSVTEIEGAVDSQTTTTRRPRRSVTEIAPAELAADVRSRRNRASFDKTARRDSDITKYRRTNTTRSQQPSPNPGPVFDGESPPGGASRSPAKQASPVAPSSSGLQREDERRKIETNEPVPPLPEPKSSWRPRSCLIQ